MPRDARKWLLPLEPIGVGTPMVESLSGYVIRLAWHHYLAPSRLARFVLADALGRPNVVGLRREDWGAFFSRLFRLPRPGMNGRAVLAREWVNALERLSGRSGLDALTLLRWSVLPDLHLLSATRRYCPACLATMPEPYEPLLWQIQSVQVCVKHRMRLRTGCPSCGESRGIMASWARPGWCNSMTCHTWLGAPAKVDVPASEMPWHRFVTNQVGRLLADGPAGGRPPIGPDVFRGVGRAIESVSNGNLSRFGEQVRMHLSTVSLWRHSRRLPTLDAALRISYVAGFDLDTLLCGSPSISDSQTRGWLPESPETRHHVDWSAARRRVALALRTQPPPALGEVAAATGVDVRELKRNFRTECRSIVAAHAAWREATMAARHERDLARILAVIEQLNAAGRRPSKHLVQKLVGPEVSMRDRYLYEAWRERLLALGWLTLT